MRLQVSIEVASVNLREVAREETDYRESTRVADGRREEGRANVPWKERMGKRGIEEMLHI